MESKTCTNCNIEKNIEGFCNKYAECKDCNSKSSSNVIMRIKIKNQINKKQIKEKVEKNCCKNKMKDIYILWNYLELMLN